MGIGTTLFEFPEFLLDGLFDGTNFKDDKQISGCLLLSLLLYST